MKLSDKRFTTIGHSLLASVLFSWLAGCAAPEVKPPTDKELELMAGAVLAEAVYTDALLSECGAVSPELETYAQDLREMWRYSHGEALAGADAQYSQALADEVTHFQGKPLALRAIRFKHRHEHRAATELRLAERSANNRRIVCERRFGELEKTLEEKRYLKSERDQLIQEQLIASADESVSMTEVPTLAADIPRNLEPGRSYREIEKRMEQQCPNAAPMVIHNDWPHEAYGIYCSEQNQSLLVCEWGECRTP
ncbi:hypothetical protein [Marinimicrobium locisalis]|uniref:hypothetical protein n=1 Tax=Marinimicrobium locisalis TaxID=546022 RepID=UPI00322189BC